MPRPKGSLKAVPSYCLHKPSGRAVVTIPGWGPVYLGEYGTPESRTEYDRVVGQYLAGGRVPPPDPASPGSSDPYVAVVVNAFRKHAERYYRHADGTPTGEVKNFRDAVRPLCRLYGRTKVSAFGPLALKTVIREMIALGWCRTNINRQLGRIKHVFKWAAGEELVPAAVYHALQAVGGLRVGRSEARESTPVRPVAAGLAGPAMRHLSRPLRAAAEIQSLTAMRAGEVLLMRGADVDRSGAVWVYTPRRHKTAHHGHARTVDLGPRCQEILVPFIEGRDPEAYLFSPAEAMADCREARAAARKTPRSCGNVAGSNRKRQPRRRPGDHYTVESYWRAISKACERAFPPPRHLACGRVKGKKGTRRETPAEWRARLGEERWRELEAWTDAHSWHSHQLRHARATEVRRHYGVEAARQVLGQKSVPVAELYAEQDRDVTRRIMAEIG